MQRFMNKSDNRAEKIVKYQNKIKLIMQKIEQNVFLTDNI